MYFLLLLLFQASGWTSSPVAPTVGDTVTLVRRVQAEPASSVRLQSLEATESMQPLMPPQWSYAEGTVAIVYRVAFFAAGEQALAVPAVEIVSPDGQVVSIPASEVVVRVASVLPPVDPVQLRPHASMGPLARQPQRLAPAIALPLAVLVGMLAWVRWRRRRLPRPPVPEVLDTEVHVPLEDWIAAGESRAVATVVAHKLRGIVGRMVGSGAAPEDADGMAAAIFAVDHGPEAEALAAALHALDRARFSPAAPADIHEVVDEAERAVREFEAVQEGGE